MTTETSWTGCKRLISHLASLRLADPITKKLDVGEYLLEVIGCTYILVFCNPVDQIASYT